MSFNPEGKFTPQSEVMKLPEFMTIGELSHAIMSDRSTPVSGIGLGHRREWDLKDRKTQITYSCILREETDEQGVYYILDITKAGESAYDSFAIDGENIGHEFFSGAVAQANNEIPVEATAHRFLKAGYEAIINKARQDVHIEELFAVAASTYLAQLALDFPAGSIAGERAEILLTEIRSSDYEVSRRSVKNLHAIAYDFHRVSHTTLELFSRALQDLVQQDLDHRFRQADTIRFPVIRNIDLPNL